MSEPASPPTRRRFLTWLVTSTGIVVGSFVAWWSAWRAGEVPVGVGEPSTGVAESSAASLPAAYRTTLAAMCARLLPDEPGTPGSDALGVFSYVERELAQLEGVRRIALRGAAQLDKVARARCGRPFAAATAPEQDDVIAAMLAGAGVGPRFSPTEFVRTMLGLTLEGAFGDPAHGGNRGEAGWRLIGYAMHPPRPDGCGHASCE